MGTAARIAEMIQEKGWVQGQAYDDTDAVCTSHAATTLRPPLSGMEHALAGERILAAIMELFPERTEHAFPATSFPDMVATWTAFSLTVSSGTCSDWCKIVHFNDHKDTTLGDLMLVLKHADVTEEGDALRGGN